MQIAGIGKRLQKAWLRVPKAQLRTSKEAREVQCQSTNTEGAEKYPQTVAEGVVQQASR
jgi:hypothetical protein